jgi:hypothetical protein
VGSIKERAAASNLYVFGYPDGLLNNKSCSQGLAEALVAWLLPWPTLYARAPASSRRPTRTRDTAMNTT